MQLSEVVIVLVMGKGFAMGLALLYPEGTSKNHCRLCHAMLKGDIQLSLKGARVDDKIREPPVELRRR